jgi:hypothetical protein
MYIYMYVYISHETIRSVNNSDDEQRGRSVIAPERHFYLKQCMVYMYELYNRASPIVTEQQMVNTYKKK